MQALCPACNKKKGNKMPEYSGLSMNLDAFRPGQRGAYDTIVEGIRSGKDSLGIVLPPRYGKSDVMRMSAIRLIKDRIISRAFLITPNSILTAQLLNQKKLSDMQRRYGLDPSMRISTAAVEKKPTLPFFDVDLMAMNIQMANSNIRFFDQLVKDIIRRTGLRPAVFFDEAHTGSIDNTWGRCIRMWQEAGAFVVALTATPFRTDKGQIPGFTYNPIANEPITIRRPSGDREITISEGVSQTYVVEADFGIGFREVWDEEDPPVLCKVSRMPFEVHLDQLDGLTDEVKAARVLSDLSQEQTRGVLMEALKDEKVIEDACQNLVQELGTRRDGARTTAAIVFVGNDEPEDEEANQHAKTVASILNNLEPDLKVVRATSADRKADETIQGFIDGDGDVLIVKQMGGVGLDIDRLKVCLDLSNIRTRAAFIQRLTRICTVWDRTGKPQDRVVTADYITPDDCFGAALFQSLIRDEGGEAQTISISEEHTEERRYQEPAPPPDYFEVTGTDKPEFFEDTDEVVASGEKLGPVQRFLSWFPELGEKVTKPRIAQRMDDAGIRFEGEGEPQTTSGNGVRNGEHSSGDGAFVNLNDELKQRRDTANKMARELVRLRIGVRYKPKDPKWQEAIKEVWLDHNKPWRQLSEITRIEELDKIIASMKAEMEEYSQSRNPTKPW